ncbi:MAG: ATP-binding protein [bacterium]
MAAIQFFPEQKLLQSIGFQHRSPLILIIPTLAEDGATEEEARLDAACVGALRTIFSEYYRERYTRGHSQLLLINMFHEPLRNAMEHGNRSDTGTSVVVGIWLGSRGVLFAFRDHGDYFSRAEVKKTYESRTLVQSTRLHDPGGYGCVHLYKAAEDIVVATAENTLYATYLLKDFS